MPRKPAKRKKSAQFNVRMPEPVRERFKAALDGLKLQRAGGGDLTRTDLVEYWAVWFVRLSGEEQRHWARTYREAFAAYLADLERDDAGPPGNPGAPDRAIAGPVVTMDLLPPSEDRAVEEDHHGPQRKPRPRRPTRK